MSRSSPPVPDAARFAGPSILPVLSFNPSLPRAAAAGLALLIFGLDTFTDLDIAIAVLYVAVVLISAEFCTARGVLLVGAGCIGLTIFSFFFMHVSDYGGSALGRCAVSLAAITATTLLVWRAKSALLVLREQARLLDLTHDSVVVRDAGDRIRYWNRGAEELYGWTRAEALGHSSHELLRTIFPEPLDRITAQLHRSGIWEGELVHARRDGGQVVVASRWSMHGSGDAAAVLETNIDITARKQAEDRLREAEAELRTALGVIPATVWRASPEGEILFMNGRLAGQTLPTREAATSFWRDVIHPDDLAALAAAWEQSRAHGTDFEIVARLRSASGEHHRNLVRGTALRDAEGAVLRWYGVNLDIEAWKQAEDALLEMQAQLAHAGRIATLGELGASIAHEVNQPLAAIIASGEAALRWLRRPVPELAEVAAGLERIIGDGRRAAEVIGRLRAMARKEAAAMAALDLNDSVADAVRLLGAELRGQQVALRLDLAPLPPVRADRVQVQQVVVNLIMNAVQAMAHVDPAARGLLVQSRPGGEDAVIIRIRDSGGGIDAAAAEKLFDAFFSTKPGGMGIGLSICRSIIAAHGGRIWAEPNDGPGATFQFTLPVLREPAP